MASHMTFAEHLREATVEDLHDLRRQIGEAELKIKMLQQAEKILAIKFEPPPPKKVGVTGYDRRRWRNLFAKAILAKGSPMRQDELVQACPTVPQTHFNEVVTHSWLVKNGNVYGLSPEGRQATS